TDSRTQRVISPGISCKKNLGKKPELPAHAFFPDAAPSDGVCIFYAGCIHVFSISLRQESLTNQKDASKLGFSKRARTLHAPLQATPC
ncbi:hypothetical protein, partial [uncultured Akkermansia sp.]|uniref:hypothetical protein n=1 Tax=uncultured Akkermansia sp. TaxID=512294 RepID=UPI002609BD77